MSAFSAWLSLIAGPAADSIGFMLVMKWTVVLAFAWLAHGMLGGRNPRWRVAVWRTTVVGIALVALVSSAPLIVKYRFTPARPATVAGVQSDSVAHPGNDRAVPAAVAARGSIEASVGSLLLVVIGGFGVTHAERSEDDNNTEARNDTKPANDEPEVKSDDPAKSAATRNAGRLIVRAVAAATGEPIEGVSISYRGRFGEKSQDATVITGEDGIAAIEWPPGAMVHRLWFTASAPKLVPIHIAWDDNRHPLELPPQKELRFEPGNVISGIVQDEAGHPILGATIEVHGLPTEYDGSNYNFSMGKTTTDAQGRWRVDYAPKDASGVLVFAKHPRYRPRAGESIASIGRDSVVILKKGLTVTGHVLDAAGRPVAGARAVIGRDIWGTSPPTASTDERAHSPSRTATVARRTSPCRLTDSHPFSATSRSKSTPHPSISA